VHNIVFYESSKADQEFMLKMIEDKQESDMIQLRIRLNKDSNNIAKTKNRLIKSGLIKSIGHGRISFVLPFMKDYLEFKVLELSY
jgi:predicted transcriptional regulator